MPNNKEKKIKVFDIAPSSNRPKPVSEKKQDESLKVQKFESLNPPVGEEEPMKEKIEEAEEKIEQKTQEVGKEFLSKWFYKKKKAAVIEEDEKEIPEIAVKPVEKSEEDEDFLKDEISPAKTGIKFGKYIAIAFILIIIAGGTYAALEILPKAEIKITAKKTAWNFNNSVSASKNSGDIDLANKQIPANFFSEKKNASLFYPATGKGHIEKKASGEITIYNAYGSQTQGLVANTRFESPDGKIFRIENKITVPGAKIENGKIVPASIKVKVTADKAGDEYNIGPAKFTIPGFKGTPKYEGFYARSESSMSGGFVGDTAYPTDAEIETAKEKTESVLEESLTALISSQIPADFKIIEGGRQFNVIKEDVNQEVNQDGNFSVFAEGELTVAGFKEPDLLGLMGGLAQKELGEGFKAKEYSLEYGTVRPEIQSGKINFSINYSGMFWQPIDIEQFKNSILGKKETELKVFVFSLNGVERATVSLWPFWVKKVPDNIKKVKVEVE
ncbi:MAG: hypothetical protein AAB940_01500 [Patescibacteria group bacterium]